MNSAEEVDLLRRAYEDALSAYEGLCASLNRLAVSGIKPSAQQLEQEQAIRARLDVARRAYLDAWMLP